MDKKIEEKMSEKKIKMSVYLSKEEYEKIKSEGEKYNMSASAMATTSMKLGMLAFDMATDPKMKKVYEKKFNEVMDERSDEE